MRTSQEEDFWITYRFSLDQLVAFQTPGRQIACHDRRKGHSSVPLISRFGSASGVYSFTRRPTLQGQAAGARRACTSSGSRFGDSGNSSRRASRIRCSGIFHELRARLQLIRVAQVACHEIVERDAAVGVCGGVIRQQLPHAEMIDGGFEIFKIGDHRHRERHHACTGWHAAQQGPELCELCCACQ